ncbi:MAG: insulinase family protein [Acidobacteriota bacterium]
MRAPASLALLLILGLALVGCQHRLGDGPATTTSRQPARGTTVPGFTTACSYRNDSDELMGGRHVHESGFVLDLLRVESVPQVFLWVNSFPTSDQGEPHTQEHLLLGKGNVGRRVASLEDMSLTDSSAFTMQWRTCYHSHTSAGAEVFFDTFEAQLDALLHPDYSDEEIRREVRNFGIAKDAESGRLRLEEKGTVYNEMVRTFENPWSRIYYQLGRDLYGGAHPLAYSAGGTPEAIRTMTPEDIRGFHRDNYHLANMGAVVFLPSSLDTTEALRRFGAMFERQGGDDDRQRPVGRLEDLPPARGVEAGHVSFVEFPTANPQAQCQLVSAWPPERHLDLTDSVMLDLLLDNLAGDESSLLYGRLVDSSTRRLDLGASGVFAWSSQDPGEPVYAGLVGLRADAATKENVDAVVDQFLEGLADIADWKEGSEELTDFDEQARSRLLESRRLLRKLVNSPPRFGFRGTGAGWMQHLDRIQSAPGDAKSLTLREQLAEIERRLEAPGNAWADLIERAGLLKHRPVTVVSRPQPSLRERTDAERQERIDAELRRLAESHAMPLNGDDDAQAVLRRFEADDAAIVAEMETIAAQVKVPGFLESPPLSLDPELDHDTVEIGGVPMIRSRFPDLSGGTVGLALSLRPGEVDELTMAFLPVLLTDVGFVIDGRPVPHEEVLQAQRREVLSVGTSFDWNRAGDRLELVVRGAGSDDTELRRAFDWMGRILGSADTGPDWRDENLPRILDLVRQVRSGLRSTMQGAEEGWVSGLSLATLRDDDPRLLAASCFLTREHLAHRLYWRLQEAPDEAAASALDRWLTELASEASVGRERLASLLDAALAQETPPSGLPESAVPLAREVLADLQQLLTRVPDEALARDWAYACEQVRRDLARTPAETLADLRRLWSEVLQRRSSARLYAVASPKTHDAMKPWLSELVDQLDAPASATASVSGPSLLSRRIAERGVEGGRPLHLGLVNPDTGSGVFLYSASMASHREIDRSALLDLLAARVYGGGGAHSLFMKTWGAGLAYSNGMRASLRDGRLNYYAERCPELPQTLSFVISELAKGQVDDQMVDYAIAQVFDGMRSASTYESRGQAMAADLVDGVGPEVVESFRKSVLALRDEKGLAEEVGRRLEKVTGTVLPGFGPHSREARDPLFLVVGPDAQLDLHEAYLATAEPGSRLVRLYPRDYWLVDQEAWQASAAR